MSSAWLERTLRGLTGTEACKSLYIALRDPIAKLLFQEKASVQFPHVS